MLVQYLQHSWQMKEQRLEFNISFYLVKLDKQFNCSTIVYGIHSDLVDSLVSTIVYMFVMPLWNVQDGVFYYNVSIILLNVLKGLLPKDNMYMSWRLFKNVSYIFQDISISAYKAVWGGFAH